MQDALRPCEYKKERLIQELRCLMLTKPNHMEVAAKNVFLNLS